MPACYTVPGVVNREIEFSGSSGANLENANLDGATLDGATMPQPDSATGT